MECVITIGCVEATGCITVERAYAGRRAIWSGLLAHGRKRKADERKPNEQKSTSQERAVKQIFAIGVIVVDLTKFITADPSFSVVDPVPARSEKGEENTERRLSNPTPDSDLCVSGEIFGNPDGCQFKKYSASSAGVRHSRE